MSVDFKDVGFNCIASTSTHVQYIEVGDLGLEFQREFSGIHLGQEVSRDPSFTIKKLSKLVPNNTESLEIEIIRIMFHTKGVECLREKYLLMH